MVSGAFQTRIYDIGKSVHTLATNSQAQSAFMSGLGNWWQQIKSGNAEVWGETVFNVASMFTPTGIAKLNKINASKSLFSKAGKVSHFAKGKATGLAGKADDWANAGRMPAFAGNGKSIFKVEDKLPDLNVQQKQFNKVTGSGSKFIPEKVRLKNGEIAYKSVNGEYVRSLEYLKPDGTIKWPEANGFVVDANGKAITFDANLKAGQIIDRYGDPGGRFTSPVTDGNIFKYDERGLPYPETSQTYHRYKFIKDINKQTVQEAYNSLSDFDRKLFDLAMKEHDFNLEKIATLQMGSIAEVFGAGGGTQIQLGTSISWYEKLGLLEEIQ
ncbi:TNT domain-containing protein [Lactococcus ileimucosae]|uniref:TNT domain-containing protein n=1 Tax=Lactococcus ileimucosae TaxID=2941329 RepID=UPI0020442DCC|nr:glycohydrolase toxin TNT-related protein [Lactococcus ileimucosae]